MTISQSLLAPEDISFEGAIALTQSLLSEMETGKLSDTEIKEIVTSIVKTENGARGFFVTYLTEDGDVAELSPPAVLKALAVAPDIVAELLVKNLAMSTAMVVHHARNQDHEMAASANRVRSRSALIISSIKTPVCQTIAQQILAAIATGEGNYAAFLQKWGYDRDQKDAIAQTLRTIL
ncbi:hypothetical protein BCD67_24205 [Oscillatoriales cyanobacterium USR001]|nr:hypothetical protein BCD67_24205 [Oscillatoriales cyanobacterium USR001]